MKQTHAHHFWIIFRTGNHSFSTLILVYIRVLTIVNHHDITIEKYFLLFFHICHITYTMPIISPASTWWLIPLCQRVVTALVSGRSNVNRLATEDITHLLSRMNHQVHDHIIYIRYVAYGILLIIIISSPIANTNRWLGNCK